MDEQEPPRPGHRESPQAAVPLIERCPACGAALEGRRCKVYCSNEGCVLYRRIIENCAGD